MTPVPHLKTGVNSRSKRHHQGHGIRERAKDIVRKGYTACLWKSQEVTKAFINTDKIQCLEGEWITSTYFKCYTCNPIKWSVWPGWDVAGLQTLIHAWNIPKCTISPFHWATPERIIPSLYCIRSNTSMTQPSRLTEENDPTAAHLEDRNYLLACVRRGLRSSSSDEL